MPAKSNFLTLHGRYHHNAKQTGHDHAILGFHIGCSISMTFMVQSLRVFDLF